MMGLTSMRTWMLLVCCLAAAVTGAQEVQTVVTQVAPVTWTTGTYLYDGSGNIKSIDGRAFTYDAFGRLVYGKVDATNSQTYTYDDFGNMLTVATNAATATRFGVDTATNRMSKVTDPSGAPYNGYAVYNPDGTIRSTVAGDTFTYDGLGMVTETKVGVNRTVHLYSPSDERIGSVAIENGAAAGKQWTIRDPSGAVLTRFTETAAGDWNWDEDYVYGAGRLLAASVSGPEKVRHFHADHLGTPRVITGNGGVELSRHTYLPFGEEVGVSPDAERAKFTGHERDDPTLDYMHARYYAVKWGRFLSVDPKLNVKRALRQPQNWNRYSYVMNNPLTYTDPTGEDVSIKLNFNGDWSDEDKKKIIAQVSSWYQNQKVGKVYVFDGGESEPRRKLPHSHVQRRLRDAGRVERLRREAHGRQCLCRQLQQPTRGTADQRDLELDHPRNGCASVWCHGRTSTGSDVLRARWRISDVARRSRALRHGCRLVFLRRSEYTWQRDGWTNSDSSG